MSPEGIYELNCVAPQLTEGRDEDRGADRIRTAFGKLAFWRGLGRGHAEASAAAAAPTVLAYAAAAVFLGLASRMAGTRSVQAP